MYTSQQKDLLTALVNYFANEALRAEEEFNQWCDTDSLCHFDVHYMTDDELFTRYRELTAVRPPLPLPKEVLEYESQLLHALTEKKGIQDADKITSAGQSLAVWKGDITSLKTQAIVNSANKTLLGTFNAKEISLDKEMHFYSGTQMRLACRDLMGNNGDYENAGNAKITPGFNLPAKYVIHTVGPQVQYKNPSTQDKDLLASCYTSCLSIAEVNDINQISFPCISTAYNQFPRDIACKIAVESCIDWMELHNKSRMNIIFTVNTFEDFDFYQNAINRYNQLKAIEIEKKLQEEKDNSWRKPLYYLPNVH